MGRRGEGAAAREKAMGAYTLRLRVLLSVFICG